MPQKPKRLTRPWKFFLPDEAELPVEQRAIFTLNPLTLGERMQARDTRSRTEVTEDGDVRLQSFAYRQSFEMVRDHLVDAEGVPADGPAKWPGLDAARELRERWIEENLEDLDILTIGKAIIEASFMGEPLKNFSLP